MKNLLLIITIHFIISCSKTDNTTNPNNNNNKTTKEIVTQNNWVSNESQPLLRTSQEEDSVFVSFELDSTISVTKISNSSIIFSGKPIFNQFGTSINGLIKNSYYINVDSINVNFRIEGMKIGKLNSRIYDYTYNVLLNRNTNTLTGKKVVYSVNNYQTNPSNKDTTNITFTIQ